ncbi:uncharacterized protein LOC117178742 [Belonocnema kinseyi]|uniref:uncharacterized protein LOC117178742 n=1 Tax=Belonocnema kinseyi TaxID=2817044 RepID=UPI00143DBFF2|nr:uncharacterized protein LOC117178742 [Belonocnema kinseyi]XP_033226065.1 uncharacterized protein LOC117178742 [Belonocnema kinseyi]XP_033226066.1 uncharacterized protein LOC117178742 [Belonocnema kinseyi]
MKTYKLRSLKNVSSVKSSRKRVRTSKRLVTTPRNKNCLKNVVQSNRADSTPAKLVSDNISIGSGSNFNTPSKINSEFLDTSHLGDFEILNMKHNMDDILNWKDMQFQPDSTLDYTCPDVILRVLESEGEQEKDPLFVEIENEDRKSERSVSQSPLRKSVNKSSPRESNRKRKASFGKKQPKSEYKLNKSNEEFSFEELSSEEEMDMGIESILEELYHVEKKEILSSRTIEKLQDLEVRLTHKVPAQHQIESHAGSRMPTQLQKKNFEKHHSIIKGKFSQQEDKLIKRNWTSFCKVHDWDEKNVQPFLYLKHQGRCHISSITERKKFVQFLANGLPDRTLYSVYFRFRRLFGTTSYQTKGRFTEDEDKKIKLYMKGETNSNNKCAQLAKILGRTRQSVFLRFQLLKKTSTFKRKKEGKPLNRTEVTWTVALIEEFLQQLMAATLSEDVKELKYALIPKVVWLEMESKMHIDHAILANFWFRQLHIQLFAPSPIYLNDVKIKLIEILYKNKISHPREIIWTDICMLFDGLTAAFLCRVFHKLMQYVVRKNISRNFVVMLKFLHDEMIPHLKEQPEDKYLPSISFENKTIRMLDYKYKEEEVKKRRSERLNSSTKNNINHDDNSDVTWTLPMREKFLNTLLVVTLCTYVDDLKNAIIPKVVWEEVAKRMSADEKTLIELWYKEMHMQLFSPIPIYMNDVKIKLIELIYKEQIKELDLIRWPKVCRYFDGMTSCFISEVFFNLIRSAQKEIDSDHFGHMMEYLYKTVIPKLKTQPNDKYLPRVCMKNEKLSIVVEEFQKYDVSKEERKSNSSELSTAKSKNEKHIIWTVPMREKFIKKLLVVTLSEDLHELKSAIIPKVLWDEMEKKMEMDQKILRELWYYELHMQLFCPDQIFMNDIKIKLIKYFYRENITELTEIFWPKVCKYFDGFTTFFLSKIFYDLIRSAAEEIGCTEFSDILEYLYEKKIQSLKDKSLDVTLPRLVYERGLLKVIHENIEQ